MGNVADDVPEDPEPRSATSWTLLGRTASALTGLAARHPDETDVIDEIDEIDTLARRLLLAGFRAGARPKCAVTIHPRCRQ